MNTILGLLGVALFIPSVIGLAAAVTWGVVRITTRSPEPPTPA